MPEVKVLVAHGQMRERQLEGQMLAFQRGEADVLLCTTIIESGLDIPRVNTILMNRADALGLAQLYQLRGRVGRGSHRAYAYLLIPTAASLLSGDAQKRLEAIQDLSELGSGYRLANMDLEIRGAGDLLGAEQSGNLRTVGYETYMELLEQAIEELRGNPSHLIIKDEIVIQCHAQRAVERNEVFTFVFDQNNGFGAKEQQRPIFFRNRNQQLFDDLRIRHPRYWKESSQNYL